MATDHNVRIPSSSLRLDKPGTDWPAPPVTATDPNGDDDD